MQGKITLEQINNLLANQDEMQSFVKKQISESPTLLFINDLRSFIINNEDIDLEKKIKFFNSMFETLNKTIENKTHSLAIPMISIWEEEILKSLMGIKGLEDLKYEKKQDIQIYEKLPEELKPFIRRIAARGIALGFDENYENQERQEFQKNPIETAIKNNCLKEVLELRAVQNNSSGFVLLKIMQKEIPGIDIAKFYTDAQNPNNELNKQFTECLKALEKKTPDERKEILNSPLDKQRSMIGVGYWKNALGYSTTRSQIKKLVDAVSPEKSRTFVWQR